jgi:trimeric autotransporter adhesin
MARFTNSINTNNTELDILTNGGTLNIGTDAAASTAITIGNANGTTGLTINVGSSGITIPSFTNYGAVVTTSSGLITDASSTAGYVLTGNSGSAPTFQAITAVGAVTQVDTDSGNITPTSGVITISGGTTGLTTTGSASTVDITGVLNLANGGTNANLTASDGGIFYSTASAGAILAGTATAKQILMSGSSTTPAWSTATYPATTTVNELLYSSANNIVGQVTAADYGVLISSSAGVPEWLANGTTGEVLTATTSGTPSWAAPATSGTVTTVSVVSANGFAGTVANASSTPAITIETTATGVLSGNGTAVSGSAVTQYGVVVGGASNAVATTAVGATGTILQGNTGAAPTYSTTTYPSTNAINTLLYASSANVMAALATADNGVLITGTTGIPSILADGTTGQVLTATTGSAPSWASPGAAGFVWNNTTGSTQTMAVGNGYVDNGSGSPTVYTLPSAATVGQIVAIQGTGTGLWKIAQNANQYISFNAVTSTTGTGGYIESTGQYDAVTLICNATNVGWVVNTSMGTITVH